MSKQTMKPQAQAKPQAKPASNIKAKPATATAKKDNFGKK